MTRTVETARDLRADPYELVFFRGHLLDQATASALIEVEVALGYRLTLTQGIGTSVGASAGTHAKGRVVDLAPQLANDKLRAAKDVGFAIYYRPRIVGLWSPHIHGCLILEDDANERGIAPLAFSQIGDFRRKRNGLANHGPDPTYRPHPPRVFTYNPDRTREIESRGTVVVNNVTRARDALVEAAHALGTAAARLEDTPKRRTVARAGAVTVRGFRRGVLALLASLPKS